MGEGGRRPGEGDVKNNQIRFFLIFDPGTVVPLGAPGSINMLPHSQKTPRAHYPALRADLSP